MPETAQREVYLLSPRELSPETIAVTFAKTSRSPQSFREIAAELTDERSAEFHEKWVVGYGHASIAEHAVLHIAFENVSRLAVEAIESHRLASYTEKSTRYQHWPRRGYHVPAEITGTTHERLFREACEGLFDAYHRALEQARTVVQDKLPRLPEETESRWEARVRSEYVDSCRYYLPAAALANVGMTANARVLEHAIRKMLSHRLQEVREIGEAVKTAAQAEVPSLLKYADRVPYLTQTEATLAEKASPVRGADDECFLSLVSCDPHAELRVLAAALQAHGSASFNSALACVESMSQPSRQELARALVGTLGVHDAPLRYLEHATYTFEAEIDQGAYFELKRHRMMTQTPQGLTAELGYAVPRLLREAGCQDDYCAAMEAAARAYRSIADWDPQVAGYVVPNGFHRRLLMTLNLREAYHFCELRSAPHAHFAIRRLALRMAEMIRVVHPLLASGMRLPQGTTWQSIEEEHFVRV